MQNKLTLETLGDLDNGAARAQINRAIDAALTDLEERGDDGKPRKVAVTLQLDRTDDGTVIAQVGAKTVLPPFATSGILRRSADAS
jgi:phage protein U